jgi:hypothetical protein
MTPGRAVPGRTGRSIRLWWKIPTAFGGSSRALYIRERSELVFVAK